MLANFSGNSSVLESDTGAKQIIFDNLGSVVRFNLPEAALDIDTPADASRPGIEVVPLPL